MDLAPPGLDEVMALTRILTFWSMTAFDTFVLDSAATGHFIRLLELPGSDRRMAQDVLPRSAEVPARARSCRTSPTNWSDSPRT